MDYSVGSRFRVRLYSGKVVEAEKPRCADVFAGSCRTTYHSFARDFVESLAALDGNYFAGGDDGCPDVPELNNVGLLFPRAA